MSQTRLGLDLTVGTAQFMMSCFSVSSRTEVMCVNMAVKKGPKFNYCGLRKTNLWNLIVVFIFYNNYQNIFK